jgi:POT family proton-dependent oligopeptide transporter
MATRDSEKIAQSVPQKGFFGHPKGLFTLFFTEFWERFSYYGMRAILLYYMYDKVTQGGLGIKESTALSIMSVYGALVYMSGIIGGWMSDRLFGSTKTVFYGGLLIMLGHIVLALPLGMTALFISMILIVLGTGLLKPNVSTVVGDLYTDNDTRRDAGFSIFYMGINLGAFIAPLIVGTIGQKYNFHYGFSLAAFGMFLGLVIYVLTKKKNLGLAGSVVPNPLGKDEKKKVYGIFALSAVILAIFVIVGIMTGRLTIEVFTGFVSIFGIVIPALYFFFMYRSPKTTATEKSRLLAYIPLFIAAVMFWAIEEQGSNVLAIYADKRTDLNLGGYKIQSSWFQSLNPLFIVALAPIFAGLWVKLGDRQPSTPKKFAYGLVFAGLSFLIMIIPAYMHGTTSLVSPIWLVLSFFLVVVGELLLSPVGLSATTKLAPSAFSAQTMSLWFLSNAAAQALNAQLVKFYNPESEVFYFGAMGIAAILLGVVLLFMSPMLKRAMKGVR